MHVAFFSQVCVCAVLTARCWNEGDPVEMVRQPERSPEETRAVNAQTLRGSSFGVIADSDLHQ